MLKIKEVGWPGLHTAGRRPIAGATLTVAKGLVLVMAVLAIGETVFGNKNRW